MFWFKTVWLKISYDLEYKTCLPGQNLLDKMMSRLAANSALADEHLSQNGRCRCQILGVFGD